MAAAAYQRQPGVFLGQQTAYDQDVLRTFTALVEAWERENAQEYASAGDLELWEFRKRYYEQFLLNCSNYMVTMVVNDKFIAQDADNGVVLVDRRDKVFTAMFYPEAETHEHRYVRFQVHTYERSNHFHWPSTHWIFSDDADADSPTPPEKDRFMVRDHDAVERLWSADPATYPHANVSSPVYEKLTLDPDLLTSEIVNTPIAVEEGGTTQ